MMKKTFLFALAFAISVPAFAQGGDQLFKQRCAMCHVGAGGKPSTMAPGLGRVVGRKAGATTYNYSPALKKSGLVWTMANLDKFLAAPTKAVPGTKMVMAVPDKAQRTAIISYMATLK